MIFGWSRSRKNITGWSRSQSRSRKNIAIWSRSQSRPFYLELLLCKKLEPESESAKIGDFWVKLESESEKNSKQELESESEKYGKLESESTLTTTNSATLVFIPP